jgi:hypothetical protein
MAAATMLSMASAYTASIGVRDVHTVEAKFHQSPVHGTIMVDIGDVIPEVGVPNPFPVPTTSRCIVIIVCQYMIIFTALAVYRTSQEFMGLGHGDVAKGLEAAAQTLTYGPMICVLFIACRMRVEYLSDGKDQPQIWVQKCMYAMTFSVVLSSFLVLCIPLVTGKHCQVKDDTGDLEAVEPDEEVGMLGFYILTGLRYLILLGLYGGLAGVIVGICIYLPPGADGASKLPPPAPAVTCTMILAVIFFVFQLIIAICRTYSEFMGQQFPKVIAIMNAAASTVEFAPMLAIVFLAARMRALQHDGQPQPWAQQCMYASTAAMSVTALLAVFVPLILQGTMKTDPVTREVTFEVPNSSIGLGYAMIFLRFACMLCFYGGVVCVIVSIFTFESPHGPEATKPVSPTVHCVVNLACQFFFVYLVLISCSTVSEVSGGAYPLETYKFYSAIQACRATIGFAPMLAILFVTTRMYALLITDKKGAPQVWVQDGMFMATWSLFISFLSCLITGFVMDEVETDKDGNVVNKFSNQHAAFFMVFLRYCTMLLLYGGVACVIVGLFIMTPETATGRDSVPAHAPPGPHPLLSFSSSVLLSS